MIPADVLRWCAEVEGALPNPDAGDYLRDCAAELCRAIRRAPPCPTCEAATSALVRAMDAQGVHDVGKRPHRDCAFCGTCQEIREEPDEPMGCASHRIAEFWSAVAPFCAALAALAVLGGFAWAAFRLAAWALS